jgi:homogentisate 1,2-dioxygenase
MPFYHKLGQIPHKRHTQFKKPNGKLYREELMGLEGFSSLQSILYHHFLPPRVAKTNDCGPAKLEYVDFGPIRHRAFQTHQTPLGTDPVSGHLHLLGNNKGKDFQ